MLELGLVRLQLRLHVEVYVVRVVRAIGKHQGHVVTLLHGVGLELEQEVDEVVVGQAQPRSLWT